jgi:peptidoglycan hydrolase-like protein with peptidoglycan-binding domain
VLEVQCRIGIWAEGHSQGCCGYDGIFGSRTYQRVLDVQRWCRAYTGRTDIAIDGIVGPVTWRMLHAYSCWA